MSDPFFSVIIPTYNNEKEIRISVNSVLSQTYRNFELILVDDGSKDETASYCDQFAEQDNRVRVVHKENRGTAAARNTGLFLARGRYVYFVDADDWIEKELLQEAARILDCQEAPDIYVFGMRMILEKDRIMTYPSFVMPGLYSRKRLEHEIYPRMMYPRGKKVWMPVVSAYLCDKIILKDLLLKHYCRDTTLFMGEESVCAYECMYFANKVYFAPFIMYTYNRLSESSMHQRYHEDLFTNSIRVAQYYRTYLSMGNKEIERQINYVECKSLKYVIEHELEFNKSVYRSSLQLNEKMKQFGIFPICPLEGLSFSDKCFVLLFSTRLTYILYIILLYRKVLIQLSHFWRRAISIVDKMKHDKR